MKALSAPSVARRLPRRSIRTAALAGGWAVLFTLSGCAGSPSAEELLPRQVDSATASRRIVGHLRQVRPEIEPAAEFPVSETTPPGLWPQLYTQTFQVTDDLYENETFAVTQDTVMQLGSAYRGSGMVAMLVDDVDRNGEPDLTYATGSGSGIMRFEIGVLDRPGDPVHGAMRERRVPFSYRNPVRFEATTAGLDVWDRDRNLRLGGIRPAGGGLRFEPATDLPRNVRERFLEPRM